MSAEPRFGRALSCPPMVEPTTGSGRALNIAAGLGLWALLVLASAPSQIQTVERQLVASSPDQFRSTPGSVRSWDVKTQARPGPFPNVFRLPYPPEWLSPEGEAARPLALFIDARRAAWLPEEPFFDQLDPERIYAYIREPKSQSLFVVCPRDSGCSRVEFVRHSIPARVALAASLEQISRPAAFRIVVEFLLFGILVWFASNRLSRPWLAGLILFLAASLYLAEGPDANPGLTGTLAVGLALLAGPARSLVRQGFDWSSRVCRPGAVVALPHGRNRRTHPRRSLPRRTLRPLRLQSERDRWIFLFPQCSCSGSIVRDERRRSVLLSIAARERHTLTPRKTLSHRFALHRRRTALSSRRDVTENGQ